MDCWLIPDSLQIIFLLSFKIQILTQHHHGEITIIHEMRHQFRNSYVVYVLWTFQIYFANCKFGVSKITLLSRRKHTTLTWGPPAHPRGPLALDLVQQHLLPEARLHWFLTVMSILAVAPLLQQRVLLEVPASHPQSRLELDPFKTEPIITLYWPRNFLISAIWTSFTSKGDNWITGKKRLPTILKPIWWKPSRLLIGIVDSSFFSSSSILRIQDMLFLGSNNCLGVLLFRPTYSDHSQRVKVCLALWCYGVIECRWHLLKTTADHVLKHFELIISFIFSAKKRERNSCCLYSRGNCTWYAYCKVSNETIILPKDEDCNAIACLELFKHFLGSIIIEYNKAFWRARRSLRNQTIEPRLPASKMRKCLTEESISSVLEN